MDSFKNSTYTLNMGIDVSFFSFYDGFLFKASSNEDMEELFDVVEESGLVVTEPPFLDLEQELFPALIEDIEKHPDEEAPVLQVNPYMQSDKIPSVEGPANLDIATAIEVVFNDEDLIRQFQRRRAPLTKRELYEFLKNFFLDD